ncbi:hypothetical protein C364_00809 [Cryptococcus neoformans Bt63]|nr:hypothetical protein C364_00809 [Cryptococcus neoformans var. grubii Bt63]
MPWQQGEQNNAAYWSASGMMKSDLNTGELPHFTSKAALTPELYDMIVEFRTTCHFWPTERRTKARLARLHSVRPSMSRLHISPKTVYNADIPNSPLTLLGTRN